ncbi:predicted protein [Botrytis cinerea T4]|uniref:Uncharacterized protein n=1 Tax=Botryotinia fuckeliana (strain T4) TaxID=999810 RepID=G2Y1C5_BOTF4|nr:predicted protein [Botrytis cinerea T4]
MVTGTDSAHYESLDSIKRKIAAAMMADKINQACIDVIAAGDLMFFLSFSFL